MAHLQEFHHPYEIQGTGNWESGPQPCWAPNLWVYLQAPCPTTLIFCVLPILSPSPDFSTSNHGIEAHFPHRDYLTQDRCNAKLRPQEAFSVLWHPWLEDQVDMGCSPQSVLPCTCFQPLCWIFPPLHQLACFCRAHRFLLRPLNCMFNIKHGSSQNTSPCFAKP